MMQKMNAADRRQLAQGLAACGADGWLLFNFQGHNPVATRMLGIRGLGSRRIFVLLRPDREPVALVHKIELQPMADFPGKVIPYARWEELHGELGRMVEGTTVAMEVSPRDGVPYLDRVPHGIVGLVESLGGKVVSSGTLVSYFVARWKPEEVEAHCRAAEVLARVANEALAFAVTQGGQGLRESELQRRVVEALEREGVTPDHAPIVGFGPNAADGHYEPIEGKDRALGPDEVVLIDLFGRYPGMIPADQTWMGFSGSNPPDEVRRVWAAVRDGRDAALELIRRSGAAGQLLSGYQVDRAARDVIEKAGYGEYFVHRTGHSIDQDLHGSGPHMDDFETKDDRVIVPGCGFSVEPGVYLRGRFGVRSEVNVYWGEDGPVVTPVEIQRELVLPS